VALVVVEVVVVLVRVTTPTQERATPKEEITD
jgi:hypothetical protein